MAATVFANTRVQVHPYAHHTHGLVIGSGAARPETFWANFGIGGRSSFELATQLKTSAEKMSTIIAIRHSSGHDQESYEGL